MRPLVILIVIAVGTVFVADVAAFQDEAPDAAADAVLSLPGYNSGDLSDWARVYSGYITTSGASQRRLFYSLVKSRRDPLNDPLILWLQGGPGCSSMGIGFWSELGPFNLRGGPLGSGEEVVPNNFTWAQVANVVFLESPAFTGFSTSQDSADRSTNDDQTTADHVTFLRHLLRRHAFLRSSDLYLAGESYAGHYLPLLATKLLSKKQQTPGLQLSLKGIIAVSPWTSSLDDNVGAVNWWYGQGIISRTTREGLLNNCQLAKGALWRTAGPNGLTAGCNAWRDRAYQEAAGVNLYALNAPTCTAPPDSEQLPPGIPLAGNPAYEPCAGRRIQAYMNRLDVQVALHAISVGNGTLAQRDANRQNDPLMRHRALASISDSAESKAGLLRGGHAGAGTSAHLAAGSVGGADSEPAPAAPLEWRACTSPPNLTYAASSIGASVAQLYPALVRAGLRMMILSGNEDGYVPTLGTRSWLEQLERLQVKDPQRPIRPWRNEATSQVGGFVTSYVMRVATEDGKEAAEGRGSGEKESRLLGGLWQRLRHLAQQSSLGDGRAAGAGSLAEEFSKVLTRDAGGKDAGVRDIQSSKGQVDLVVVMNAGHSVPVFHPAGALQLVSAFLDGQPLDDGSSSG